MPASAHISPEMTNRPKRNQPDPDPRIERHIRVPADRVDSPAESGTMQHRRKDRRQYDEGHDRPRDRGRANRINAEVG